MTHDGLDRSPERHPNCRNRNQTRNDFWVMVRIQIESNKPQLVLKGEGYDIQDLKTWELKEHKNEYLDGR